MENRSKANQWHCIAGTPSNDTWRVAVSSKHGGDAFTALATIALHYLGVSVAQRQVQAIVVVLCPRP